MDYTYPSESLNTETKMKLQQWLRDELKRITGEDDQTMVDYISVMIDNFKSMHGIASELIDLVGETDSMKFASKYISSYNL
jgi:hypothetical protein